MKRIYFFNVFVFAAVLSIAQPRYGIVGGGVMAKTNEELSNTNTFGFQLGMVMESKLGKSFVVKPQIQLIKKGTEQVTGEKGIYNYLELPINFLYKMPLKRGRVYVGAGPALAYMISGSWALKGESKEVIYFDFDKVNRFDYGINTIVGYEIKGGFFFNINYTMGLRDVWYQHGVGSNKNRVFGFSIGKMFS
jgi:hypothetical protein